MRATAIAAIALILIAAVAAADTGRKVYVCPMSEHAQEFDAPGTCPLCGMQLVEKNTRFRVAVLIFDHVEDIDFTAPIEVLGGAGAEIFTVAATTDPIQTVYGLHIKPDYDLASAPPSEVLLVPGGGIGNTLHNDQVTSWIGRRAEKSRYVMSVCNGAFILAKARLLDGLTATTTASHIDELAAFSPKTHVVRERVTDNGKVMTSGGLSAGIDGALHLIEREYGRARAERVARGIEYNWQPDLKWSRAKLADSRLPDIKLPKDALWQPLTSHGDTSQWEMNGRLKIAMTEDQLLDYATKQIVEKGWTLQESNKGKRVFTKKDGDQSWITTVTSKPGDEPSTFMETMSIRKVGS